MGVPCGDFPRAPNSCTRGYFLATQEIGNDSTERYQREVNFERYEISNRGRWDCCLRRLRRGDGFCRPRAAQPGARSARSGLWSARSDPRSAWPAQPDLRSARSGVRPARSNSRSARSARTARRGSRSTRAARRGSRSTRFAVQPVRPVWSVQPVQPVGPVGTVQSARPVQSARSAFQPVWPAARSITPRFVKRAHTCPRPRRGQVCSDASGAGAPWAR